MPATTSGRDTGAHIHGDIIVQNGSTPPRTNRGCELGAQEVSPAQCLGEGRVQHHMDAAHRRRKAVAETIGVNETTVATEFRKAGLPIRRRRGWPPSHPK